MTPYKMVKNSTDKPIEVRLAPRQGEKPSGAGRFDAPAHAVESPFTADVTIPPGEQTRISYGDEKNPYVDRLVVDYSDAMSDSRNYRQTAKIAESTQWGPDDRDLNSHDTATVSFVGGTLTIVMSNS